MLNNPILLLIDKISNIILQANDKTLDEGIWKIFDNNIIPELDLTSKNMNYKQMNSILQPINLLKNIDIFCIKYNLYEGCSICTSPTNKTEYLEPCISISLDNFLKKESLTNIIQLRLKNFQSTCPNCGYDDIKNIINPDSYFKIYSKIEMPKILFLNFEFIDESEKNIRRRRTI